MERSIGSRRGSGRFGYVITIVVVAALTIAVLMFLDDAARRRGQPPTQSLRVVELTEATVDPAEWGRNYPRQYDAYQRTVDTERTRHGGSEAFQKLDADPLWRELFAGYPFGIDYREERGHAYMLLDQRDSERVTAVKQPGACLHCHASVIPAYRAVGIEEGAPGTLEDPFRSANAQEQLTRGFDAVCAMPYEAAVELVEHPVSCLDCHDPDTLRLRATRPAFLEAIATLARSVDEVPHLPSIERWRRGDREVPYDPNESASRQEMRSLVCAQCHAEYYFRGEGSRVVYPWHAGLAADDIESYYDDADVTDWTHLTSRAPLLKAQHPEFELWSQGVHARSGVACADCHMPYRREGSLRVSDHHVRSPLLNVENACAACHDYSEAELRARAETIQDRTQELMLEAEEATVSLIQALEAAGGEGGLDDETLLRARDLHRRAQWRLDFVASENSMGFHAPQESARLLAEAIGFARQGEIEVLKKRLAAEGR